MIEYAVAILCASLLAVGPVLVYVLAFKADEFYLAWHAMQDYGVAWWRLPLVINRVRRVAITSDRFHGEWSETWEMSIPVAWCSKDQKA